MLCKLEKCLTASKTICSVADTAQNAVGLAVSTNVTPLSILRSIQGCMEQISHDNTTQTESAETAEKNHNQVASSSKHTHCHSQPTTERGFSVLQHELASLVCVPSIICPTMSVIC